MASFASAPTSLVSNCCWPREETACSRVPTGVGACPTLPGNIGKGALWCEEVGEYCARKEERSITGEPRMEVPGLLEDTAVFRRLCGETKTLVVGGGDCLVGRADDVVGEADIRKLSSDGSSDAKGLITPAAVEAGRFSSAWHCHSRS